MAPYQILTDATADFSLQWLQSLPRVEIIPMRVEIGGREYTTYGPDVWDLSICSGLCRRTGREISGPENRLLGYAVCPR